MNLKKFIKTSTLAVCLASISTGAIADNNYNKIDKDEFKSPPEWAKPKTWLHSMSSNMSKAGFTKDLEAISEVGIGGVLLFNVTHQIPKGKIIFGSDEHFAIFKHAAAECERVGLQFGIHNCDGWTSSGGPWNTPENSMKMVVSNTTVVDGKDGMKIKLPKASRRRGFYQDIAVIAYPSLPYQEDEYTNIPVVTTNDESGDCKLVNDGLLTDSTTFNGAAGKDTYIQFAYEKPFTLTGIDILLDKAIKANGTVIVSTSEDGVTFTKAVELNVKRLGKTAFGYDDRFEPVVSKYFRLNIYDQFKLREITLRSTPGIENYLERVSMFKKMDVALDYAANGEFDSKYIIKSDQIIDLTSKVDADGFINVDLPEGKWTISRFGYTTSEYNNSPASDEGRGLEVDKMSREALKIHFESYVGRVIRDAQEVAPNALKYMEIDSYEVGCQNWTKGYDKMFKDKYNYDITKFLPLFDGLYVDSPETSENVMSDMRRLYSYLVTENYFKYFTELCNSYGLKSYIEPYSINGPFSELDAARYSDIPMGEFWMHQNFITATAVSGAHIYGKRVISSEAFTGRADINWKGHPGFYKTTGDLAWAVGINEYMFHRYAHQPNTHVAPGMTMSEFGSHIDRTQTWWNNAGKAWMKYIARGQYMLQKGLPISDVLVFVGDGSPSQGLKRTQAGKIPNYLNYDCVNIDVLCNRLSFKNGMLTLPEGTGYQLLVLENTKKMSLEVLRKVNEYSKKGLVIIGKRPTALIGYKQTAAQQSEFESLVEQVWSRKTTYTDYKWEQILAENDYIPDMKIENGSNINYTHRQLKDKDMYFFYNPNSEDTVFDCNFRVTGKKPELWSAMTGDTKEVALFTENKHTTNVPIKLTAGESVFVVFEDKIKNDDIIVESVDNATAELFMDDDKLYLTASENGSYTAKTNHGKMKAKVKGVPAGVQVDGKWAMTFGKGTDKQMSINSELFDWSTSDVEYIKHYSGTANYTKTIKLGKEYTKKDVRLMLSLPEVYIACRVILNGKDLGVLWHAPYQIDITDAAVSGDNKLEIEVTNLWVNRLIGDEQYEDKSEYVRGTQYKMPEWYTNNEPMPASQRSTFTVYDFYKQDSPLMPSGIVGEVTIKATKVQEMK